MLLRLYAVELEITYFFQIKEKKLCFKQYGHIFQRLCVSNH